MKFFDKLFGKADSAPDPQISAADQEIDAVFARAEEELKLKTEAAHAGWGLGGFDRWDADLEAGTITFRQDDLTATAPIQVVGTYNSADATWLWAWDHPSVPATLTDHAILVRDFGARHGLEALTTRKITADETDAWAFTALACHFGQAQGAYRGPAGTTFVFMTFGEVTPTKA